MRRVKSLVVSSSVKVVHLKANRNCTFNRPSNSPIIPRRFLQRNQIVATVVSVNPQISPDLVAMIGASAALTLSGVPFNGPIGAARVGFIDNQFVLKPNYS